MKDNFHPASQQKTLSLHMIYSVIEGAIAGILLMNEFVFVKSLGGSKELLTILIQATWIILVAGIAVSELLKRINNKKLLLLTTAILTRGPLILFALFPGNFTELSNPETFHALFIAVFFIYFMANPVLFPTINHLLKENYTHENFGKYFSWATSVKKGMAVLAAFLFGMWLDKDPFAFTKLYPVMGLCGIGSIMLLAGIPHHDEGEAVQGSFWEVTLESIRNMFRILKTNKPFRDFEIGFMFYGFAFMVTVSSITLFQIKVLDMNYTSMGFYKSYYNILAIILLPFCGKLISKVNPDRFAIYTYLSLFFYLLFLVLAEFFPMEMQIGKIQLFPFVLLSFTANGVFTAMMALLWGIGSAYFSKKGQAGTYQSIHITLTGARALLAPIVGVLLIDFLSYKGVFIIGMISLLGGICFLKFKKN